MDKRNYVPWYLFGVVVTLAFIVFGQNLNWNFENLTIFSIFPILGILAWSIMWTHYVDGAIRITFGKTKNKTYSHFSGVLVLFLILIHPGLLALSQFQNNGLLPPGSYFSYVGTGLVWAILFAETALVAFLSYEVLSRLKSKKIVAKNWIWVSLSQAIAMTLIFFHGLALGRHLSGGWFQFYWVVLGALLIPCFGIILKYDWQQSRREAK
jgi:TM2 domain-containing membrane protein YozV